MIIPFRSLQYYFFSLCVWVSLASRTSKGKIVLSDREGNFCVCFWLQFRRMEQRPTYLSFFHPRLRLGWVKRGARKECGGILLLLRPSAALLILNSCSGGGGDSHSAGSSEKRSEMVFESPQTSWQQLVLFLSLTARCVRNRWRRRQRPLSPVRESSFHSRPAAFVSVEVTASEGRTPVNESRCQTN